MKGAKGGYRFVPELIRLSLHLPLLLLPAFAAERLSVDFSHVEEQARHIAAKPYDETWGSTPDFLRQLDYDTYREITFNAQKALWAGEKLPFHILLNHPGGIFDRTMAIHEFTATHEQEIGFAAEFFDYGKNESLAKRIPGSLGYAGFRVLCALNEPDTMDECAVFLGSNYFRVLA